jgi:hypothetical protein
MIGLYGLLGNPSTSLIEPPRPLYIHTQEFLAHGWWFSLGTPASSTTKTGRHDIVEILLKVALNKNKSTYV